MSGPRLRLVLAAGLLAGALAMPAAAQPAATACANPMDPACNHLKCYQIKDKPIRVALQVDNQFGREKIVTLQPVLLCLPSQKSCCNAAGCSPSNCPTNPVPAPALPHFKCYKIKGRTACAATDPQCTTVGGFPKKTIQVNLRDQFGTEGPISILGPRLLCAPVEKKVVGATTTTTTATTSTTFTTTTIQFCHFDSASPTGCTGPCPPTVPPGSQCQLTAPNHCDCKPPPVCCQCTGAAGMGCFNTNNACPPGCAAVGDAQCDPTTRTCECGFCRGSAGCLVPSIPCDANNPCPQGAICDPVQCPRPCAGPCDQPAGQCSPAQCFKADGTVAQCRPSPLDPCGCCGPTNDSCATDFDCCSGICNSHICQ